MNNDFNPPFDARTKEGLEWLIDKSHIVVREERGWFRKLWHHHEKPEEGNDTKEENHVESFPAIADAESEILILGTMPGETSLTTGEYYAQKGNIFWEVISTLYNEGKDFTDYTEKIACLKVQHIALWDVLACCQRKGSSDNAIGNEQLNDIESFLKEHPKIRKIVFNGKKR